MALATTSATSEEEEKKRKQRKKVPKSGSKRCYMHFVSVKNEGVEDFTQTRWDTYRNAVKQWLCLDVAETFKHCVDLDFAHVPEDAGFHATCCRRFICKRRLCFAEKRCTRTVRGRTSRWSAVIKNRCRRWSAVDCISPEGAASETKFSGQVCPTRPFYWPCPSRRLYHSRL